MWSTEMAAIRGCPERRFGPGGWSQEAVVVFEQPGSDQPFSGGVLRGVHERVPGAVLARTGERAVQHHGGGEVERLGVVPQAAGDLAVVEEAWSWSERVVVMPDPGEDLAGVREAPFESLQGVDGSGQRPSQAAGELLRGARFPDAREHRLDGAVIRAAVPVEVVDRASPGIAGPIGVLAAERAIGPLVNSRRTERAGPAPGGLVQRAISAAAASSRKVAQGGVA